MSICCVFNLDSSMAGTDYDVTATAGVVPMRRDPDAGGTTSGPSVRLVAWPLPKGTRYAVFQARDAPGHHGNEGPAVRLRARVGARGESPDRRAPGTVLGWRA